MSWLHMEHWYSKVYMRHYMRIGRLCLSYDAYDCVYFRTRRNMYWFWFVIGPFAIGWRHGYNGIGRP